MTEKWTEQMGWRDTRGGWEWDMRWMELGTTRERDTALRPDQENREEKNQEEQIKGEEQNEDRDKNNNKKEAKGGSSDQDTNIAKGCKKPAIVNKGEKS